MERTHRMCENDLPCFRTRSDDQILVASRTLGWCEAPLAHQEGKTFEHIFVLPVFGDRFHFSAANLLHCSHYLGKIAGIGHGRIV